MTRRQLLRAGLLALGAAGSRTARAAVPAVRVDQLGYRPGDPKVALVGGAPPSFAVRDAVGRRVVLEGKPDALGPLDPASGDRVAALEFSALDATGTYVVTAPGCEPSPPFAVGETVYAPALAAVLRVFPYHRCGAPVRDGSPWARPACHLADGREWGSGARRDVTGGWHDAGDYGKYVPAAGLTLWHLAELHERLPLAGLLDELRWELDWLRRMQRADGGVHHKVAVARWTANHAPHQDPDPRFFFAVSSSATAIFAAATARASRLFRPLDAAYAGQLLAGAQAAWRWLEAHPEIVPAGGFRNPPGAEDGEYADDDDRDERLWAASELWFLTGEAPYRAAVAGAFDRWSPFDYPASWRQSHNLAYLSLLQSGSPLEPARRARLRKALTERSDWLVDAYRRTGYRVALTPEDYYWGSNGVVVGRAVQLLAAFHETGRVEFRDAALDQLHYLLGRNTLGKSFVTGFGSDPVRRPTHQPSLTHPGRLVLPGLLVGGPNARSEGVPAAYPARAYRDDSEIPGVNEPTVYWQAALAYLLAHFVPPR